MPCTRRTRRTLPTPHAPAPRATHHAPTCLAALHQARAGSGLFSHRPCRLLAPRVLPAASLLAAPPRQTAPRHRHRPASPAASRLPLLGASGITWRRLSHTRPRRAVARAGASIPARPPCSRPLRDRATPTSRPGKADPWVVRLPSPLPLPSSYLPLSPYPPPLLLPPSLLPFFCLLPSFSLRSSLPPSPDSNSALKPEPKP